MGFQNWFESLCVCHLYNSMLCFFHTFNLYSLGHNLWWWVINWKKTYDSKFLRQEVMQKVGSPLLGFEMESGCQDPHSPVGMPLTSSSSEDKHHVMYHQNSRKVAPEVLRKNPYKVESFWCGGWGIRLEVRRRCISHEASWMISLLALRSSNGKPLRQKYFLAKKTSGTNPSSQQESRLSWKHKTNYKGTLHQVVWSTPSLIPSAIFGWCFHFRFYYKTLFL